jgi:CRP-like cAMP-binding protein
MLPTGEGEFSFSLGTKVGINTVLNVIEVRRGNVLGYLTEGNYAGEHCLLDSGEVVRYPSNITAMEDTDLLYLTRESLVSVKEDFPEIQSSIQQVLNIREKNERQKRLFNDTARGDDTISILELKKMLAEKLFFTPEDIAKEVPRIDTSGDNVVDEYEFVSRHLILVVFTETYSF